MNFSTFDIEKIKHLKGAKTGANNGSVSWYANHNANRDTSKTADPDHKHLNISRGNAVESIEKLWNKTAEHREAKGLRKMRADTVRGVEVMLSASQDFFKKNSKGEWQVNKNWLNKSKQWAIDHYEGKGKLVQWDLTRDERGAPKLKMIFAPLNSETESFNATKFVGNKQDIKRAQQSYAALMKNEFGLEPPTTGSKIKNNKKVDSDISEEARIANHDARVEENKRIALEKENERRIDIAKKQGEEIKSNKSFINEQRESIKSLKSENQELTGQIERLIDDHSTMSKLVNQLNTTFAQIYNKFDSVLKEIEPVLGTFSQKWQNANDEQKEKLSAAIPEIQKEIENTLAEAEHQRPKF